MIGVVIVTYNSSKFIESCLDSLIGSDGAALRIVISDNASSDATVRTVRAWAEARQVDFHEASEPGDPGRKAMLTLIRSSVNRGFAGGVNRGLRHLRDDPECGLFWILNPDCRVAPDAAAAFQSCADGIGEFALMGSRILYIEAPGLIQSDGGRLHRWSGTCENLNQGENPSSATRPKAEGLDFLSGASLVASRLFVETVGPMREDYFIYYEEVDWAAQRGSLPLVLCDEALIHHHGGTAIGTGSITRRPSPFATYFNFRNRIRYLLRFDPIAIPTAYLASQARITKMILIGAWEEAKAAFLGLHQLPPPRQVREKLSPDAFEYAFGRHGGR